MQINKIRINNFRNLSHQIINFHPQRNIIFGENAQGKTNLLEAVYLISSLKSFRAQQTKEMINFSNEESSLAAIIQKETVEKEIKIILDKNGKRVFIDRKRLKEVNAYQGPLNAILFLPEDLRLARAAPTERRGLIDRAIAGVWPSYVGITRDYQKILQSRNRLIKKRPGELDMLLDVYDQKLSEIGAKIIVTRWRYLQALAEKFMLCFQEISQSKVTSTMVYLSSLSEEFSLDDIGVTSTILNKEIKKKRALDLKRQMTSVGPHVDDIGFYLDKKNTKTYGSQGQLRMIILAFKIAQIMDTHERRGSYPLLLLDDVSSELDERRNQYLFNFINKIECQIFVTTTRVGLIPIRENSTNFHVDKGMVQER